MRARLAGVSSTAQAERCAWCGCDLTSAAALRGRRVCRCGVATTSPWPTEDELAEAYGDHYRPAGGRFLGPGDWLLRRTRGRLATRLDQLAPPGPVLDVGAGDGALLDALHAVGRSATGLERESSRSDVMDTDVEHVGDGWAAIVFWHSLEHLRQPSAALAHAAAALQPGGVLVLAMPNTESIQAQLFGDHWLALDLPRHLTHMPAAVVVARLAELGLSVEFISHLRGGQVAFGWLHGLVGSLPGHPNLYDAIRRPGARERPLSGLGIAAIWGAAVALAPVALAGAVAEAAAHRGGSIYIEARRAS